MVSLYFSGEVTLHYSGLLERASIMCGCAWNFALAVRLSVAAGREADHSASYG
jgi:hypothetical protein